MLDLLVGRPNKSWRRKQTLVVVLCTIYCLVTSGKRGPRYFWVRPLNRLLQRFTPWQLITSALSLAYVLRNLDRILGLDDLTSQTKISHLYSSDFNRAAWVATALDAGFATALNIQPKWLRDILSIVASVYYLINSDEADSKICRLREQATLQTLRGTWNKTSNVYLRLFTAPLRPSLPVFRQISLARPKYSGYRRPITTWLFFDGTDDELSHCSELILDIPGGGFVAMDPKHHEERLRLWAKKTKRPILSVDYGKAPEFPYPFAIEECFDLYCVLSETSGRILGMSGSPFSIILSGDSAGANIAVNVMFKIIEASSPAHHLCSLLLPHPRALALTYAALNFAFGSWVWPLSRAQMTEEDNANALKQRIPSFVASTPLSADRLIIGPMDESKRALFNDSMQFELNHRSSSTAINAMHDLAHASLLEAQNIVVDSKSFSSRRSSIGDSESQQVDRSRVILSSKAGYIHDRILNPSMMWSMTLLYLGPNPPKGFDKDYHLNPLFAPDEILAQLPPVLLQCGARDPLVDDTLIFADRIRTAKRKATINRAKELRAAKHASTVPEDKDAVAARLSGKESFSSSSSSGSTVCDDFAQTDPNAADDVTVQIFPGWSHGYLQMLALMKNARVAVDDLADWMIDSFDREAS